MRARSFPRGADYSPRERRRARRRPSSMGGPISENGQPAAIRRQAHALHKRRHIDLEATMNIRPSILCPVDYSNASAGALRYAAAIAEHLVTRLIVLSVEDPLLAEAVDLGTGGQWSREDSERELERFVRQTFGDDHFALAM